MSSAVEESYNLENEYLLLSNQLKIFETQLSINEARLHNCGVQLKFTFDEEEMLILHNLASIDGYKLKTSDNEVFQIISNETEFYRFILCKHNFYMPISLGSGNESISECLEC